MTHFFETFIIVTGFILIINLSLSHDHDDDCLIDHAKEREDPKHESDENFVMLKYNRIINVFNEIKYFAKR